MKHKLLTFIVSTILILSMLSGCSQSGIGVSPVSGTITLNGEKVGGAFVSFVSKDGSTRNASGVTDDAGHFELQTSGATHAGAMPGEYIVLVSKTINVDKTGRELVPADTPPSPVPSGNSTAMSSMPLVKSVLPEKYNMPAKPLLEATVTKRKNQFTFDLDEK
ncbi:MAG: hypothetical protein LBU65_02175 [Planctomycetaceae bacterium]|jgi:hypothetical protein|nr:hypothetical protein [Planctomycetaceae bacterium]